MGNCKCELIDFYNNEDFEDIANEDWFNSLEIYRVQIIINESGNIVTFISGGDDFWQDHLLDIEITNREISSMSYDG